MAVYVGPLFDCEVWSKNWPYKRAAHMTADSEEELVRFARRLGLKDNWIQHRGRYSVHYDLTEGMRAQAIRLGAKAISFIEEGEQLRRKMEDLRGRAADGGLGEAETLGGSGEAAGSHPLGYGTVPPLR